MDRILSQNKQTNKQILTWEDSLDVPGEDEVESGVKQHHPDTGLQVEGVIGHGTLTDVLPLRPDRLLLIARHVGTTEAEGNVGRQALETRGITH